MASQIKTAKDLVESGARPKRSYQVFQDEIRSKLESYKKEGMSDDEALQALFPNTILDPEQLRPITSALLSGTHVLMFGPSGSGKTSIAKEIWDIFPKTMWVVADCPVQEDPFSLIDPEYAKIAPPCPFCKMNHGNMDPDNLGNFDVKRVDPSKVPVKKINLREGHGYARIQGSAEVFPDNLSGTINLHKLQEIGDPTSPLVLEPGKLLQANRGVLIIDEVGKLPIGTQNVLLQSLQEGIVTPAKSRETFPANFIAVCTSNVIDLDNITEPLNDRLSNIHVGFTRYHAKNRMILELAISSRPEPLFVSEILMDAAVNLIEAWRNSATAEHELSEVASNRAMIDIIVRARAHAMIANRKIINKKDFMQGCHEALLGRIRARGGDSFIQNTQLIQQFIAKHGEESLSKGARRYWCKFFREELRSNEAEGRRILKLCEKAVADPRAYKDDAELKEKLAKFIKYVNSREHTKAKLTEDSIQISVFKLLNTGLECSDEMKL